MNLGKIQIGRALRKLEERISMLSILVEILNPYFHEYTIINAHPLSWLMVTINLQIYGLVTRCWFDRSKGKNVTLSVVDMYYQIRSTKRYSQWKKEKQNEFDKIGKRIKPIQKKYQKKLRRLSNKYILHNEYRTQSQTRKEKEKLEIGWIHIEGLLRQARELTNVMSVAWSGKTLSFESNHYQYFSKGFWSTIKPIHLKPTQPSSKG